MGILAMVVLSACFDGGDRKGGIAGSGGSAGSVHSDGGFGGKGSGGIGGNGGTAGHGAGGYAWYEDPAIWQPIPESEFIAEVCRPLFADPVWTVRKVLDWQPCGTGCERSEIKVGHELPGLYLPVATTAEANAVGMGFLSGTGQDVPGQPLRAFRHTLRLDDGYLLSLLQLDSSEPFGLSFCRFGRTVRSALVSLVSTNRSGTADGERRYIHGAVDAALGETDWFPPWHPQPFCDPLPIETDGGLALLGTCRSLSYFTERSDDPIVLNPEGYVIPSSATQYRGFVVWPEFLPGGDTRIRAWTPEGGMYTLLERMPGITCQVALNGESLIGWQVGPEDHCEGYSDDIRFWRAPFTKEAGALKPVVLPPLSDKVLGGSWFSGWGDHAMLTIVEKGSGEVYRLVVRFSDGTMRKLRPHPDNNVNGYAVTLSERFAYLGQTPKTRTYGFVDVLYRWDLSQLENWGEPWATPEPDEAPR